MSVSKEDRLTRLADMLKEINLIEGVPNDLEEFSGEKILMKCIGEISFYTNNSFVVNIGPSTDEQKCVQRCFSGFKSPELVVSPNLQTSKLRDNLTIHQAFHLPHEFHMPDSDMIKGISFGFSSSWGEYLNYVSAVLLNHVSMFSAVQLDNIGQVLRRSFDRGMAFGGKRMVFIGDLFQNGPIVRDPEKKPFFDVYETEHPFQSKDFIELDPIYAEFNENTKGFDHRMHTILTDIRSQRNKAATVRTLNKKVRMPGFRPTGKAISLVASNDEMDRINMSRVGSILKPYENYGALVKGDFKRKSTMPPQEILLCETARVMFTDTYEEGAYRYGELGEVVDLERDIIVVKKDSGEVVKVQRHLYEQNKLIKNEKREWIRVEIGQMRQFPLTLAYALTTYRSVGLCFDEVHIPNYGKRGNNGLYVALSHCKSLDGLHLGRKVFMDNLSVDKKVEEFCRRHNDFARIEMEMEKIIRQLKAKGLQGKS